MGKTLNALMAREFDLGTAERLENSGYTLNSLKKMNSTELKELSLTEEQIQIILKEPRPPIPNETLIQVLFDSRWCCCVCRNQERGVIIHHIVEYSQSRSHDEENLVVLCLHHHGEAHTRRELQLNLTPEKLKEFKKRWIEQVKELDLKKVLGQTLNYSYPMWDYFNHRRLIDLSQQLKIDMSTLRYFSELVKEERINDDGTPAWDKSDSRYMYDAGFMGSDRKPYLFYASLVEKILENVQWIKLYPNNWNHSFINAMVKEGSIVICKGAFYFKNLADHYNGAEQMRKGLRRCHKIHLNFTFDGWETTSSSAHALHLSGRSVATVVCLIRSRSRENKNLLLNSTVLAIGNGFGPPHNEHDIDELEEEL
jgi:hypothetical protein